MITATTQLTKLALASMTRSRASMFVRSAGCAHRTKMAALLVALILLLGAPACFAVEPGDAVTSVFEVEELRRALEAYSASIKELDRIYGEWQQDQIARLEAIPVRVTFNSPSGSPRRDHLLLLPVIFFATLFSCMAVLIVRLVVATAERSEKLYLTETAGPSCHHCASEVGEKGGLARCCECDFTAHADCTHHEVSPFVQCPSCKEHNSVAVVTDIEEAVVV